MSFQYTYFGVNRQKIKFITYFTRSVTAFKANYRNWNDREWAEILKHTLTAQKLDAPESRPTSSVVTDSDDSDDSDENITDLNYSGSEADYAMNYTEDLYRIFLIKNVTLSST